MENLPHLFSDQGLFAIVFTIVAAVASVLADKKSKHNKRKTDKHEELMITRAFNQMEKNLEELRRREEEVKHSYYHVKEELEDYRQKYYRQIEINNTQSAQLTKLNLELFYRTDRGIDKPE
jgi:uncharacterized protein YlxW (UPF0749 family)